MSHEYLVVGAGITGASVARLLADRGEKVRVFEKRGYVAGNCYTEVDAGTGIILHMHGAHIFHTGKTEVWDFIQRFCKMNRYVHKVLANTARGTFWLPINIQTLREFFAREFSPDEAERYLKSIALKIESPKNFEEQALSTIGSELYEAFFKGYTVKQWGISPKKLPASIFSRLPVRLNMDNRYFSDKHQGIPVEGYTEMITRMLDHKNIKLELNRNFNNTDAGNFRHVFYTGRIDEYFEFQEGELSYRTVYFETDVLSKPSFQSNSVVNYCSAEIPYTRIIEHKLFDVDRTFDCTVISREYSKETESNDIPCYPKRRSKDMESLERYAKLAASVSGVSFGGRLGQYKYLDMDKAVETAFEMAGRIGR